MLSFAPLLEEARRIFEHSLFNGATKAIQVGLPGTGWGGGGGKRR